MSFYQAGVTTNFLQTRLFGHTLLITVQQLLDQYYHIKCLFQLLGSWLFHSEYSFIQIKHDRTAICQLQK